MNRPSPFARRIFVSSSDRVGSVSRVETAEAVPVADMADPAKVEPIVDNPVNALREEPVSPSPPARDRPAPSYVVTDADDYHAAPSPPPVYHGEVRATTWNTSPHSGMTAKLVLLDLAPHEPNPFYNFGWGKENGQRLRTWIGLLPGEGTGDGEIDAVYSGETILKWWTWDPSGKSVTIFLDNGPDGVRGGHPFDDRDFRPGAKEGPKLVFTCWAISEDETLRPAAAVRKHKKTPFYQLSEVKQANILCRDQRFISYLKHNEAFYLDGELSEVDVHADGPGFAADVLRRHLGIESRAHIMHETVDGERARVRFKRLVEAYVDARG